ncbi:hypothetical protein HAZT_HAZT005714 [Hyalella azteca]|uniref:ABC transporter domain-containing protein n=1 Tax=Hyalella azteca TaxID=294128 RepID=A0A6A0HCX1_HYAAZ|nr:hypothetical protein HAZT_HAZT005714 [Hyalella azteca]
MSTVAKRREVNLTVKDLTYWVPDGNKGQRSILKGISGNFNAGQLTAILGPSGSGKTSFMNIAAGCNLRLTDCRNTRINDLSGGETKRLSIALELINNPPVMLFDEPTSGLDSRNSFQCVELLHSLARGGRTIICTLHQPSARIFQMFDQLYALSDGQCIYRGTIHDLLPFLDSVGLQCPPYHNPADFLVEVAVGEYGDLTKKLAAEISCRDISASNDISLDVGSEMLTKLRLGAHVVVALLIGLLYYGVGAEASKVMDNTGCLFFVLLFFIFTSMMPTILTFPLEMNVLVREHLNRWYSLKSYYMAKVVADMPFQLRAGQSHCYACLSQTQVIFPLMSVLIVYLITVKVIFPLMSVLIVYLMTVKVIFPLMSVLIVYLMTVQVIFPLMSVLIVYLMTVKVIFPLMSVLIVYLMTAQVIFPLMSVLIVYLMTAQVIFPLMSVLIVYLMTAQPLELWRMALFSFICILTSLVAQSIGLTIGAAFTVQEAVFLGPASIVPLLLFSGFFIQFSTIPIYMRWITYLSFVRYGFEGVILSIYGFGRENLECSEAFCYLKAPSKILETLDVSEDNIYLDIGMLFVYFLVVRVVGYYVLRWKVRSNR